MKDISNLLEQVNLIQQKYDDLAEYTGENFNIFRILNLHSNELSHSAFIGDLLNTKAKHGQKDVFLNLFLDELRVDFEEYLEKFGQLDTARSSVKIEYYIGIVDNENGKGGRFDIFITDSKNTMVIENKIWAGDQYLQLLRYYTAYENSPILYLTLDGKEPDISSKGELKNGEHYICISYEKHIVNWMENCIKEMANKPVIRETLNQYLHLVKQLTNQTSNNKMGQETVDLILKNESSFKAFETIVNTQNQVRKMVLELDFKDILEKVAKNHNLDLKIDEGFYYGNIYQGFTFYNRFLESQNLKIRLDFQGKDFKHDLFGLNYIDNTKRDQGSYKAIQEKFKTIFGDMKSNNNFACFLVNSNWTSKLKNLGNKDKLYDLRFGKLKEELEADISLIVSKLLEIVKND